MNNGGQRRQFASDNYSGICPEAWEALREANEGHLPSYGNDAWTTRAADLLRELFETDCEVFFCFNGTAANAMAVSHLCRSYHSVICHEFAHIETDECGGPEFFSNGTKILLARGEGGKIEPQSVEEIVRKRDDIHFPRPRVLSLTQATELGTVYSVPELLAVREVADRHDLRVHMDGARLSNAVASLGVKPKEVTWKAGVDVLCFGGTKNGMPYGEAVIFFDRHLAHEFDYHCKQAGQLASKMRFIAAPWVGCLQSGAWLRNAQHGNDSAARMEQGLRQVPGIAVLFPRQANSVFVSMPAPWAKALEGRGWRFYSFIGSGGYRLMCSWDTTAEDVDAFVRDVRDLAGIKD